MPAIRTTSTLSPTITKATLGTAIKAAFAAITSNVDYAAPLKEYTDGSSNTILVYRIILNGSAAKGTIYQQISISNTLVVQQRFSSDFNTTTNASTNNSPYCTSVTFSASSQIFLAAYDHPEIKGVILEQAGSTAVPLCYCYPQKPSWWSEDSFTFAFIPQTVNWNTFLGLTTTNSPYNHAIADTYGINALPNLSVANPITNRRDILPGAALFCPGTANQGVAARFSAEVVQVAGNALARFDILQVAAGVEEYQLLQPGAAGALAIRVV